MAGRKLDDYRPAKFYAEHTKAKQAGFSKFEADGEHYFCRYVDGDIAMISQSYSGKAGRDNGIESVKKNEKSANRYKFEDRDGGQYGFALMAGNGQEIAVSPNYKTAKAAERVAGRVTGKVKAKSVAKATSKSAKTTAKKPAVKKAKAATISAAAFTSADGRIENYKPLAFYEKHGGKGDGFNAFEESGAYYFNYADGGKVNLISESYTAKRGRDNGIASVTKNMTRKAAYEHHVHKTGKHYFDINAANGQEVATSRWYNSKTAAMVGAASLRGETVVKTRSANVEQNYMPLASYKAQTKGKKKGFESFKGEDGEHYFVYFENGKTALISEGYPTAAVRDKGLASVKRNMKTEKRYVYGKGADGKAGFALRAGNNKEIARSVGYGSAAAAAAGAAYLIGTRRRVAPKPKVEKVKTSKSKAVPIAAALAVAGASAAAAKAKPKGTVRIAGVGAGEANAAGKLAGTVPVKAAAITLAPIPVPVVVPVAAAAVIAAAAVTVAPKPEPIAAAAATPAPATRGGIWGWLKWLLLALAALLAMFFLFKSCVGGDKVEKSPPIVSQSATPAAMVTCWNGTKAKNDGACPSKVTCWDDSFATSVGSCPTQPPAKTYSCWNGSMAVDQAACPIDPQVAVRAAAAKAKLADMKTSVASATAGKMTAPSVSGRYCGPSPNVLFNVANATPINVTRLGTNPQFGNSSSYTPDEFFRRLQVKYRSSPRDKSFLDLLAKSLGYGAFSDMDASMFTNDVLAKGSSGLLGLGTQHALQYSTLNLSDPTHLDAFKVRSANGTDVHFMKRCGNFMYVCQP